jgi:hypothetical protein
VPALVIDRDAAHEAARHELAKPIYPKASLLERFSDWINELLFRLAVEGSRIPGGWFTIALLVILVVIAAIVVIRIARRTMRTNRGREYSLFDGRELSAAAHRAAAEQAAAVGNWAAAIRHRLRAVARQLEEDTVLNPVPGRTATELARDAGAAIPRLASELRGAADAFNDVTYGERPGTDQAYRMIAELDDHLRSHGAGATTSTVVVTTSPDTWTEVR